MNRVEKLKSLLETTGASASDLGQLPTGGNPNKKKDDMITDGEFQEAFLAIYQDTDYSVLDYLDNHSDIVDPLDWDIDVDDNENPVTVVYFSDVATREHGTEIIKRDLHVDPRQQIEESYIDEGEFKTVIRGGKKIRKKFRRKGERPKMSKAQRLKLSRAFKRSQKRKRAAKNVNTKRKRAKSMKRRKQTIK